MKKVLVAGGAGYIGSHICVELINEGYEPFVIDNLYNSSELAIRRVEEITGKKVPFYRADFLNADRISEIFELEHPDRNIQAGYSERPISCKNNSSGREIELRLANSSNEDKKYKDCEISGITFMRNCQGVSYKGLTKDSSLEDVINKLGIPATAASSPITVNGKENSDDAFIILSYGKYQESQMQIKLAYDPVQNTAKIIDMDYNNTDFIENNND